MRIALRLTAVIAFPLIIAFGCASKNEVEDINTRIDSIEERELSSFKSTLSRINEVLVSVQSSLDDLSNNSSEFDREITGIKLTISDLSRIIGSCLSINKFNEFKEDFDSFVLQINDRLSQLKSSLTSLSKELNNYSTIQNYLLSYVSSINTSLESLSKRIEKIEDHLSSFIRSIVYIPEYEDGKCIVDYGSTFDVLLEITPPECASSIVNTFLEGKTLLSFEIRDVKTRDTSHSTIEILSLSQVEDGIISIKAKLTNQLPNFSVAASLSVIDNSQKLIQSSYFIIQSRIPSYIVDGNNYGQGVIIGDNIWAPVNCGYDADHPFGLLYQWGRKYGQGYNDGKQYTTETKPLILEGPIDLNEGESEQNSNVYYLNNNSYPRDWCSIYDINRWNYGTESSPIKSPYDPCPNGWRLPTFQELYTLAQNFSQLTNNGEHTGRWYSGRNKYDQGMEDILFFPAAGQLFFMDGSAWERGEYGFYWCSKSSIELCFCTEYSRLNQALIVYANSVRCVKEAN